jgi:hypothetical protein
VGKSGEGASGGAFLADGRENGGEGRPATRGCVRPAAARPRWAHAAHGSRGGRRGPGTWATVG